MWRRIFLAIAFILAADADDEKTSACVLPAEVTRLLFFGSDIANPCLSFKLYYTNRLRSRFFELGLIFILLSDLISRIEEQIDG